MVRRLWVPWWDMPTATVQWRFQWVWVYGFVHPATGQTYWWLMPKVNIYLFNQVLADFGQHCGLGQHKQVLLTIDQAGWHKAWASEMARRITCGISAFLLPWVAASRKTMAMARWTNCQPQLWENWRVGADNLRSLLCFTQAVRLHSWSNPFSLVAGSQGLTITI